jgi:hypothetical protein
LRIAESDVVAVSKRRLGHKARRISNGSHSNGDTKVPLIDYERRIREIPTAVSNRNDRSIFLRPVRILVQRDRYGVPGHPASAGERHRVAR